MAAALPSPLFMQKSIILKSSGLLLGAAAAVTVFCGAGFDIGKVTVVWDGDTVNKGSGWATPKTNPIKTQSEIAHKGNALLWTVPAANGPWSEWGWNWTSWQKPGTDVSKATAFTFYMKLDGANPPKDMTFSLRSSITNKYTHQPPGPDGIRGVNVKKYDPGFNDGKWHLITIPMADFLRGENPADFARVFEVFIGAAGADYTLAIDDIGFVMK